MERHCLKDRFPEIKLLYFILMVSGHLWLDRPTRLAIPGNEYLISFYDVQESLTVLLDINLFY